MTERSHSNPLDPNTSLAIDAFEKWCKAEKKARQLQKELAAYASKMPDEDLDEYYRMTRAMERKYADDPSKDG